MSRKVPNWIDLRPVRATALDARGPGLRGPTAIKRLVIEELEVGRLHVRELEVDTERRSQQS